MLQILDQYLGNIATLFRSYCPCDISSRNDYSRKTFQRTCKTGDAAKLVIIASICCLLQMEAN